MLWVGQSGIHIPLGVRYYLFSKMPGLALGPTYLPIQWVLGPSSSEVKNENFTFLQYNLPAQQFVNLRNIVNGKLVTVIGFSRLAKFLAFGLPVIS
jgi:hypothetical protein